MNKRTELADEEVAAATKVVVGEEGRMGARKRQEEEEVGGVVSRRKVEAAASDVTMDLAVLDCPICYHPLRPPIFQCTVGHTICSSCHEKLSDKCHFCSLPTVYSRCHMVERVIESIKVACSNGNHGCTARMAYYQKEDHEKGCQHTPCFCPAIDCSFSAPTTKLLDHLSGQHNWTCPKVPYRKALGIRLQVGSTVLVGEDGQLFMVSMRRRPIGGVILVCLMQPQITGSRFKCMLKLTEPSYCQAMEFVLRSTKFSDGRMPEGCIPFVVPEWLLWGTSASSTAKMDMVLTCAITPQ
ncbi:unnamed protein product [Alopecurus aequalis]